jgi:hypothetical protein
VTCCLVAAGAVLGEEFAAGTGPVGIAGEGENLGVVHQTINHGRGDNVVGERLTPSPEGQVRGDRSTRHNHHGMLTSTSTSSARTRPSRSNRQRFSPRSATRPP